MFLFKIYTFKELLDQYDPTNEYEYDLIELIHRFYNYLDTMMHEMTPEEKKLFKSVVKQNKQKLETILN